MTMTGMWISGKGVSACRSRISYKERTRP